MFSRLLRILMFMFFLLAFISRFAARFSRTRLHNQRASLVLSFEENSNEFEAIKRNMLHKRITFKSFAAARQVRKNLRLLPLGKVHFNAKPAR